MKKFRVPKFGKADAGIPERSERRLGSRPISLRTMAGEPIPAELLDLSATGFRVRCEVTMLPGVMIRVGLTPLWLKPARIVRYESGEMAGQFVGALDEADVAGLIAGE